MSRNYTHENALSKARERRFQAKLKHDEAETLEKHLAENNLTFTAWIRLKIKEDCDNAITGRS